MKLAYSKAEAAKLLGLHENSVSNAIRRGELRAVRLGTRVLIPRGELERLLGEPIKEPPARGEGGER